MARDIFNRVVDLGQPLAADATRMLLPFVGDEDFMLQSVNLQYNQKISRLWEVGSNKTFFFAGRTEGNINAKRIVGNKNAALSFVKQFGDVCNMAGNMLTLQLDSGCTDFVSRGSIKASGCVINSVAYSIQAQEMIINEDVGIMFARLEGE